MLKVQTANSTYIHCGVGAPLLKVGESLPLTEALTPWAQWGDPDTHTEHPYVGERWLVRGEDGQRWSMSPVVQITDYGQWCRRIDQPTYHLCTQHIFALAKHNDVRLATSYHTHGDCTLCGEDTNEAVSKIVSRVSGFTFNTVIAPLGAE